MSAIDKLVALGRDPLEVLWVPPAPDVVEWLRDDANTVTDAAIRRELTGWTPEMRARLRELIDQHRALLTGADKPNA